MQHNIDIYTFDILAVKSPRNELLLVFNLDKSDKKKKLSAEKGTKRNLA